MQRIIFISVIVLSLSAIIFGRLYYGNKLEDISASAHEQLEYRSSELSETIEAEDSDTKESDSSGNETQDRVTELEELTEGLSTPIESLIMENVLANEEIELVTFGSRANEDSLDNGVEPWPELLETHLNSSYGQDLFNVNNQAFGELTSNDIIAAGHHTTVASLEPDVIIMEPFNWNDNNAYMTIEDTIANLQTMIAAVEEENTNVLVFIQPPQPAFEARYYPVQVEEVREFAKANDIAYINHWESWPDSSGVELIEGYMPNQQGHNIWMEHVASYFINDGA